MDASNVKQTCAATVLALVILARALALLLGLVLVRKTCAKVDLGARRPRRGMLIVEEVDSLNRFGFAVATRVVSGRRPT